MGLLFTTIWGQELTLPVELMIEILQQVDFDISARIHENDSLIYWCLPMSELVFNWVQRLRNQRDAWNACVEKWFFLGKPFDALTEYTMHDRLFVSVFTDINTGQPIIKTFPNSRNPSSTYRHLIAFTDQGKCHVIWRLLERNCEMIESFFLEKGFTNLGTTISTPLKFCHVVFSSLRSFTFRTNAPNEWIHHREVVKLLRSSPQLEDLTIFQLEASDGEELIELYQDGPDSIPCSLRSLHLRRLRNCSRTHIQFLLSNSYESLKELTLVLESAHSSSGNERHRRGIRSIELREGLRNLINIEKLRIADLVVKMSDYTMTNRIRPIDDENQPLGCCVDDLVYNLRELKELDISDTIFSMDLFDNLKNSGCRVVHLTIRRYFQFPFVEFSRQLNSNMALWGIKTLVFCEDVQADRDTWNSLEILCGKIKVELIHL